MGSKSRKICRKSTTSYYGYNGQKTDPGPPPSLGGCCTSKNSVFWIKRQPYLSCQSGFAAQKAGPDWAGAGLDRASQLVPVNKQRCALGVRLWWSSPQSQNQAAEADPKTSLCPYFCRTRRDLCPLLNWIRVSLWPSFTGGKLRARPSFAHGSAFTSLDVSAWATQISRPSETLCTQRRIPYRFKCKRISLNEAWKLFALLNEI